MEFSSQGYDMKKSLVYTLLFLIGFCFVVYATICIKNYMNRPKYSTMVCQITEYDSVEMMVKDVSKKNSFYSIGMNELDIRDEENAQISLSESDVGRLVKIQYSGTYETEPAMFALIKKIILLDGSQ